MKFAKIVGWFTFFAGITIIVFTLYSSYNIFTGKTPVPQFFEIKEEVSPPTAQNGKTSADQIESQEAIEKAITEQLKGLLPIGTLPKLLNLIVWSILSGILIFGGTQISNLGIKLVKQ